MGNLNHNRYDTKEIGQYRKALLKNVTGEILEIGIGTGLNIPYYPSEVRRLTGIDERVKEIKSEKIEVDYYYGTTNPLPFEPNSFDTIVTTFGLSRRVDLKPTLEEIKRVLRPRGRFLFLDHGRTENENYTTMLNLVSPLCETVGYGVYNREYFEILKEYEFLIAHAKKYPIHMSPKLLKGTLYYGVAVNVK